MHTSAQAVRVAAIKEGRNWYPNLASSCLCFSPDEQNLFPIVQGGLDTEKRHECARELMERNVPGFAVGGLSGGEEKEAFWRMVHASTSVLSRDKPRCGEPRLLSQIACL